MPLFILGNRQSRKVSRCRTLCHLPIAIKRRAMALAVERLIGSKAHLASLVRADRGERKHLPITMNDEEPLIAEGVGNGVGREAVNRSCVDYIVRLRRWLRLR